MSDSFPPEPGHSEGSFPHGQPHPPGSAPEDAPTQPDAPLLFRRYRVLRELGRGGMGVVVLAHDTALEVTVALKLVPDLIVHDPDAVAGLRKEVLRGMALTHPGVVRTNHFEKDESGAAIVMEYVEGDDLTTLKRHQPGECFDPEQILPWLVQLCAVLDYAHRDARIIHRDLKPRNIMLTKTGRVKVADFGIAAVISDSVSRHSMEGTVSGTLSYMSPQQAEGKRPSHLDDIHALGATIYELLTSKPPFFRGHQAAIYQQIIHVEPPSMAERREELEISGKKPLAPQWETTVAACLAKEPAYRPQSAGEVLARLQAAPAPTAFPRRSSTLPPRLLQPPSRPRNPPKPSPIFSRQRQPPQSKRPRWILPMKKRPPPCRLLPRARGPRCPHRASSRRAMNPRPPSPWLHQSRSRNRNPRPRPLLCPLGRENLSSAGVPASASAAPSAGWL